MRINFQQAPEKFSEAVTFLNKELAGMRVGRGSLQMIENIQAEVYGQNMPLNQIANISMQDPTLVVVKPWDKNNLDAIRKAVLIANLGINPNVDKDIVRLPLPPMTEERRLEFIKIMKNKLEETKIKIRQIRKDVILGLEEDKKAGKISEDDFDRREKELQKTVDSTNEQVEKIGTDKEAELLKV